MTTPAKAADETGPSRTGRRLVVGWLVRHPEDQEPLAFELFLGENVIGRAAPGSDPDVAIPDDTCVSRTHCLIEVRRDARYRFLYALSDTGRKNRGQPSRHGVFVNGDSRRLESGHVHYLQSGDTIQVGVTKLVFEAIDEAYDASQASSEALSRPYAPTVEVA